MKFKSLQELFSDPSRWTKEFSAKDEDGNVMSDVRDPSAVCWCLYGGIRLVYDGGEDNIHIIDDLNRILARRPELQPLSIITYNDLPETTIEDIQNLVKEANV